MTMAVWTVNVNAARTIVIIAMNIATKKASCKSKELKTDTVVMFVSVGVWIETVVPNVEIWSTESKPEAMDASHHVNASAQMIVNQTAKVASKQVGQFTDY